MRKGVFFLLILTVFSAALSAQENPSITIVNNTGYTVWYVYISQTASDQWGEDYLGREVLHSGASTTLRLPFPINVVNRYDIQLVDLDGDSYTKWDLLVAPGSRIVFTFDDFDVENLETNDGPPITIVNNTGYTVWYVYISSSESNNWGLDRLASDQVLQNGESFTLPLPFDLDIIDRYDIQLVDLDGDTYTKWDVLITPNSRIVFTFDDFD